MEPGARDIDAKREVKKPRTFAEFFLYASDEEKMAVFRKAAEMANEEQRKTFERTKVTA